jgi:hypothetical protein
LKSPALWGLGKIYREILINIVADAPHPWGTLIALKRLIMITFRNHCYKCNHFERG